MAAPIQPQPNLHQLSQHLAGVSEQIALIPNMPAIVGLDALIVNLQAQHEATLAQQAQQHAAALAQQAQLHAAHAIAIGQLANQHGEIIRRLDTLQEGCVLCIVIIASR